MKKGGNYMAKTFCGKNCDECTYKEELDCPGCKQGPGNTWKGDCKISSCCDDKGHENCETCSMKASCGTLSRKHMIPQERIKDRAADAAKQERIQKKALVLCKWFPILFWLSLAIVIGSFISNDTVVNLFPKFALVINSITLIIQIFYIIILFIISSESDMYKKSAIYKLAVVVVTAISSIVLLFIDDPNGINILITFLMLLVAAIVAIYAEYLEYKGHSELLEEAEPNLSEKWDKLIKLYIICYAVIAANFILAFIPIIGELIVLAATVGSVIVEISKVVFIYRMANIFEPLSK